MSNYIHSTRQVMKNLSYVPQTKGVKIIGDDSRYSKDFVTRFKREVHTSLAEYCREDKCKLIVRPTRFTDPMGIDERKKDLKDLYTVEVTRKGSNKKVVDVGIIPDKKKEPYYLSEMNSVWDFATHNVWRLMHAISFPTPKPTRFDKIMDKLCSIIP